MIKMPLYRLGMVAFGFALTVGLLLEFKVTKLSAPRTTRLSKQSEPINQFKVQNSEARKRLLCGSRDSSRRSAVERPAPNKENEP